MTVVTPCPPSVPCTPGVVVFDPVEFVAAYPAFATVTNPALQMSFDLATTQLDNSCGSLVRDANKRQKLLYLLTAHITALKDGQNGQSPAGIVGYVNKATEGSVSVGADMGTIVYGQAYYLQSQWGLLYWQATAGYRRMRYIPAPPRCADFNGGIGFPGQFWPNTDGGGGPFDGGCGC